MDILWIVIGAALLIVGIIFSVLPILAGQVLSWVALLMLQLTSNPPFTTDFLAMWAFITVGVSLLDYYVPIWGTKKLGGSKYGMWGATFGLIIGIFFFPPFGLIIGPFFGAFVGELIAGKTSNIAFKSGLGSFLGFVAGTMMKLGISIAMGYFFVKEAWNLL